MRDHADLPVIDPPDAAPDGRASRRVRVGVGAAVVLLIAAAVVAVLVSATAQRGTSVGISTGVGDPFSSARPSNSPTATGSPPGRVLVHVTGAVRKPGLVSLDAGARVVDAVAAAGGMADDADPAAINLARPVADGEQLQVLRVGEEAPQGSTAATGAGGSGAASRGGPVNLNTATEAELETLPRIGPALAQRILDWRQTNGRFAQAADLLKVSGIGQKLFDGLKDRVAV